jgi:methylglutaconyl-CoA hydratase
MSVFISKDGAVATITLNRPDVHNAFDADMIAALHGAFTSLANDDATRVVVLTGTGKSFCAGADMRWMQSSLDWTREQNRADAEALAAMFDAAWTMPKPLLARVNGSAIGGGAGLVACCDLAVSADTARFGFGEVKIGLVPAVITQFVLPKIGFSQARALFVSGEQFTAERAFEIGLVHAVAPADSLDETVEILVRRLLGSGPEAVASAKRMLDAMWEMDRDAARRYAVETIAAVRVSNEGQEGLRAFLEKRRPRWNT